MKEVGLADGALKALCSLTALILFTDDFERLQKISMLTSPQLPWGFPSVWAHQEENKTVSAQVVGQGNGETGKENEAADVGSLYEIGGDHFFPKVLSHGLLETGNV